MFLFEIHMKEVKNRMDNREIKSREDQMTAIPLRVQNLSIEERINENEGIEFDEENYDIDIDYIVEEVS